MAIPVVLQQLGDKAIVENALVLLIQRDIIHQSLQEGHSCREQSLLMPHTPEKQTQVKKGYSFYIYTHICMYIKKSNYYFHISYKVFVKIFSSIITLFEH